MERERKRQDELVSFLQDTTDTLSNQIGILCRLSVNDPNEVKCIIDKLYSLKSYLSEVYDEQLNWLETYEQNK